MLHWQPLDLQRRLQGTDAPPLLLDVREPWELEVCQLPGACAIPLGELAARLSELDAQREIVVICHRGARSLRGALLLERAGFARVINLEGGMTAWAEEIDTAMATY
ncbi:MAG: sulfurtransferase [Proteobacteria bacterium]|nr:sulfurtransferase [Pseudomonadota bacterium]